MLDEVAPGMDNRYDALQLLPLQQAIDEAAKAPEHTVDLVRGGVDVLNNLAQ